jgi:hypothetical protein
MPVVPLDVVLPGDVLPGVDMPGDVGLPVEGLPTEPAPADPAAPPLAPPAPPAPAANAEPEDRANASASIVVVIFMTFSIPVTKDKKPGDVAFLADLKSQQTAARHDLDGNVIAAAMRTVPDAARQIREEITAALRSLKSVRPGLAAISSFD